MISINIMNYRSFDSAEIVLENLNVIVGKNDSGKSNLIRAFNYLLNVSSKLEPKDKPVFAPINDPTTVSFKMTSEETKRITRLIKSGFSTISRKNGSYQGIDSNGAPTAFDITLDIASHFPGFEVIDIAETYKTYSMLNSWDDIEKDILGLLQGSDGVDQQNEYKINDFINNYWGSDVHSEVFIGSNTKGTYTIDARDNSRIRVSLGNRGTGFQAFLYYIVRLISIQENKDAYTRRRIICIEEPERMLHPQAQRDLMRILQNMSQQNNMLHFVVTTHSPVILSQCNKNKIYLFRKDNKGKTIIDRKPYLDNWKPIRQSLGIMPSDSLFIGTKTVLVEGICEKIFIPRLLEKFGIINTDSINFVDCNGAGNMSYISMYVKELDTDAMALIDGDNQGDQALKGLSKVLPNKVISLCPKDGRKKDIAFEDIFDNESLTKAISHVYENVIDHNEFTNFVDEDEILKRKCWSIAMEQFLREKGIIEVDSSLRKVEIIEYLVNNCERLPEELQPLVDLLTK